MAYADRLRVRRKGKLSFSSDSLQMSQVLSLLLSYTTQGLSPLIIITSQGLRESTAQPGPPLLPVSKLQLTLPHTATLVSLRESHHNLALQALLFLLLCPGKGEVHTVTFCHEPSLTGSVLFQHPQEHVQVFSITLTIF